MEQPALLRGRASGVLGQRVQAVPVRSGGLLTPRSVFRSYREPRSLLTFDLVFLFFLSLRNC